MTDADADKRRRAARLMWFIYWVIMVTCSLIAESRVVGLLFAVGASIGFLAIWELKPSKQKDRSND